MSYKYRTQTLPSSSMEHLICDLPFRCLSLSDDFVSLENPLQTKLDVIKDLCTGYYTHSHTHAHILTPTYPYPHTTSLDFYRNYYYF